MKKAGLEGLHSTTCGTRFGSLLLDAGAPLAKSKVIPFRNTGGQWAPTFNIGTTIDIGQQAGASLHDGGDPVLVKTRATNVTADPLSTY
jgi:hypothetical protein